MSINKKKESKKGPIADLKRLVRWLIGLKNVLSKFPLSNFFFSKLVGCNKCPLQTSIIRILLKSFYLNFQRVFAL